MKVSDLVSVSKAMGLATVNIAKKQFSNISKILTIFVCSICR